MICYRKLDLPEWLLGAMGLGVLLCALLVICAPPATGAEAAAERDQLPYAPPPLLGFGDVLCAPSLACAAIGAPAPTPASKTASDQQQRALYEQTRPQKQVPFAPPDFDRYAGYYAFDFPDGTAYVRVYRSASRYYWQVETAGQPPAELFPESAAVFFATAFPAQVSFVTGPDDHVTGLTFHELGVSHTARRVPQAVYNAWVEELQKRIMANRPSPGTDVAVRRQLEAWERMVKAGQEPRTAILKTIQGLGTFEGLRFIKVGPHGLDVYDATFSKGALRCRIMPLSSEGKVNGLGCSQVIRPGV